MTAVAVVLGLFLVTGLANIGGGRLVPGEFGANRPLRKPDGGLQVIAFYQQSEERDAILDTVERNSEVISYLAPFWYGVLPDGRIVDDSEAELKRFARDKNIRLQPLVHNLTEEAKGTVEFLKTRESRRRVIDQIVKILDEEDYPGISMDIQLVPEEMKEELLEFMRDLYQETRRRDKMLTINVIPHGVSDHKEEDEVYNFSDLSRVTDAIILMAYDFHGFSPKRGPVSPINWVREVVEHAIDGSDDPQGIILGLPAYGYDWTVGSGEGGRARPLKDIEKQVQEQGIRVERDEGDVPHFTYTAGGRQHEVWYEDARSIARKVELAREKNLHGVAIWRVGFETPEYWQAIRQAAR